MHTIHLMHIHQLSVGDLLWATQGKHDALMWAPRDSSAVVWACIDVSEGDPFLQRLMVDFNTRR